MHLRVGHWRFGAVDAGGGGGHGQVGGESQHHPRRSCLVVQPEGHPRYKECHECGDIDGEDL